MKTTALLCLFAIFIAAIGCSESKRTIESDSSEATVASETGSQIVSSDVIAVTKPLISGELYDRPSFEGTSLAHFGADQEIQVLDTADVLFIKARLYKDSQELIGFVAKAILPE